jgi:hypothetical protein
MVWDAQARATFQDAGLDMNTKFVRRHSKPIAYDAIGQHFEYGREDGIELALFAIVFKHLYISKLPCARYQNQCENKAPAV